MISLLPDVLEEVWAASSQLSRPVWGVCCFQCSFEMSTEHVSMHFMLQCMLQQNAVSGALWGARVCCLMCCWASRRTHAALPGF